MPSRVRAMDDDEATLRNASDNVATPPPWFDLCLYVYRNAVKDSKKGLSRTALTAAATGRTGKAAIDMARALGDAGEVLEQCRLESTLLPSDTNLTKHCAAISALPPEQYAPMLALLLEHGWSVKDTQAAVERVPSRVRARELFSPFVRNLTNVPSRVRAREPLHCKTPPSPPMRVFLRLAPPAQQETAAHGPRRSTKSTKSLPLVKDSFKKHGNSGQFLHCCICVQQPLNPPCTAWAPFPKDPPCNCKPSAKPAPPKSQKPAPLSLATP